MSPPRYSQPWAPGTGPVKVIEHPSHKLRITQDGLISVAHLMACRPAPECPRLVSILLETGYRFVRAACPAIPRCGTALPWRNACEGLSRSPGSPTAVGRNRPASQLPCCSCPCLVAIPTVGLRHAAMRPVGVRGGRPRLNRDCGAIPQGAMMAVAGDLPGRLERSVGARRTQGGKTRDG